MLPANTWDFQTVTAWADLDAVVTSGRNSWGARLFFPNLLYLSLSWSHKIILSVQFLLHVQCYFIFSVFHSSMHQYNLWQGVRTPRDRHSRQFLHLLFHTLLGLQLQLPPCWSSLHPGYWEVPHFTLPSFPLAPITRLSVKTSILNKHR